MENQQIPATQSKFKVLISVILIIGFITAFAAGFYLQSFIKSEKVSNQSDSVSSSPGAKIPSIRFDEGSDLNELQKSTVFLPGKQYFEDTVIAITKDAPNYTIAATVTRNQQDSGYVQNSRMSYFNGKNWDRKSDQKTTTDSTIISGNIVKSWVNTVDPSRVLKESSQGELRFNDTKINFSSGPLENEISIRSLPGYTKFISEGEGTLIINGNSYSSYLIYTKIYSLNASDIQFYNQPFGLTTYWLIFWDKDGNFYHVDKTEVPNPTQIYQTHQLAILKDSNSRVSKTFQVSTTTDSQDPPSKYTFSLGNPVGSLLDLNLIDSINKAPNNSFKWFMGHVTGTIQKSDGSVVEGFGLNEYIHN